jgi:hypothetical protein
MSPGAKNMKTEYDALATAENEFKSVKHENWTRDYLYRQKGVRERKIWKLNLTPSITPKMSQEAQNIKTGPDAHDTAENESGSAKYEN